MNDASVFDCGGVGKVSTSSVMGTSLPERRRHRSWPEALKREIVAAVTVTSDQPIETAPARASELIEIELAGGYRLRVGGGVKAPALRLVLDVLERRR